MTAAIIYLTDSEIAHDTVTLGAKTYFVRHGVAGRPASLITRTGQTTETHHRVPDLMSSPVQTVPHYEFMETPVHSAVEHDMVVRAWEFERDLAGFDAANYETQDAEQLASAQMAYVDMIRSSHALRMIRLDSGYWATTPYAPDPEAEDDEDDRL